MKALFVVAVALVLSGCGSTDFFGNSDNDTPATPVADNSVQTQSMPAPAPAPSQDMASAPVASSAPSQQAMSEPVETTNTSTEQTPVTPDAPAPAAQASMPSSAHCTTLAKQRAQDAAFQGEEPDTQEAVYNRTYADCVAWDLKHAFR